MPLQRSHYKLLLASVLMLQFLFIPDEMILQKQGKPGLISDFKTIKNCASLLFSILLL